MVWNLEYIHVSFIGYLKKLIIENKNKKVSSEFSKYRRELFLELVKPEALWMLAISYKNLELWNLAWESYQESVRISEIVKRVLPRPYDPTLEEKKYLKTEILVGGVGHHYPDWPNVLAELKKMDEKDPAVARLWIRYFDIKKEKDLSLYMLWWKVLFESDLLQEVEIVRYSKTLKTAGNKLLRSKVNEMKAGIWFSENLKKQNKVTAPSINLMWELFESRLDIKDFSGALRVLDYLKTLEAKFFEEPISLSQVYYEKGKILLIVNNKEEARQSFEQSKTLAPSSVYGKLSASELKAL